MTAVFDQLLQEEVFVDVTLSCEGGQQLRAHKVVLAACSPYFQAVLQNNPCKHPIVILPRDVAFADLRAIIEFVYRGEIDVAQEQINSLLAAADTLKIKGLCEVGDDPTHRLLLGRAQRLVFGEQPHTQGAGELYPWPLQHIIPPPRTPAALRQTPL
ncbi:putative homeobox protein 2-like isoform X2 [Penaeus vannamei]|uniref:Putative homeobox protein 2-like isoform X2 n=1 Tax=Penaeus vannamei TaxID=6689 RepID=A0A423T2A4_PENVA|nr:putative homeobox protein 2-like isoform X2 [Penaeus vannamei]